LRGPLGLAAKEGLRVTSSPMRRLYSTFAYGAPGVGLLLLRLTAGITLIVLGGRVLLGGAREGSSAFHVGSIALGSLLLLGLWTPIAGTLVAIGAIWMGISGSLSLSPCLFVGILGAALALLGPGAFSLDAWIYGWRRIELTPPKHQDGTIE
jgi:putative oxidoreductase